MLSEQERRLALSAEGGDYIEKLGPSRDFVRVSGVKARFKSLRNLLMTDKGSWIMDPEYGTNIRKMLFHKNISATRQDIMSEVVRAAAAFDSRIQLSNVNVSSADGGKTALITADLSSEGESDAMSIPLADYNAGTENI